MPRRGCAAVFASVASVSDQKQEKSDGLVSGGVMVRTVVESGSAMGVTTEQFSAHVAHAVPGGSALGPLGRFAEEHEFEPDRVLTRQFAPAAHLFLIAQGTVRFQIRLDEGTEELDVGHRDAAWTSVGWSGLRPPWRYATTVVCVTPCRALRFEHAALRAFFRDDPSAEVVFLEMILRHAWSLLTEIRSRIVVCSQTPANFARSLDSEGEEETYNRAPPPVLDLLRRSAFFELFSETHLRALVRTVESRYYCRGQPIVEQGSRVPGLWVLATGRVALNYRPRLDADEYALRTISNPGAIVALAGLGGVEAHTVSVVATRDCTVYRVVPGVAGSVGPGDEGLANILARRLLWLVSNHLRAGRAVFISRRFDQEKLAISNVLEQSCTQLSVHSPLHRLPHLLDSQLTLGDAFAVIEAMAESAVPLERDLAQLCGDMLGEVRREHQFFEALRRVYHAVRSAPAAMAPAEVRTLCARGFQRAFQHIRYVIEGAEHLPATPGHIFILNHLKNHEYNTLPNNFQLTLDSHFVSSMVLEPRYGDGGVRVVRHSRGTEYGHQDYYDRLGHMSVYTKESDRLDETKAERRARLNAFFETGGQYLRAGTNLILSPEGTSYWTEESPGPFKAGAFRLAATVVPEPWIVPIAVANFDRRVHSTICSVLIKPPFKISQAIDDPSNPAQMQKFLTEFRATYAAWVKEARQLALDAR